jgi:UDP-N-acetyl-2-amino-2-deoxyglucuronate dehydrogenase
MKINYSIILDRKIRVAIVGCGRISKNHFLAITKQQADMDLISICDNNQDVLSSHEVRYQVKGYLDLKEMLENENIDLVAMCTPSGIHSIQTKICAKYCVNVITEKPMATKWKDGITMVSDCEDAGVRLFVVKQNRKNPTLRLLKRAITEGRFGKIYMAHINVFWTRPQEYYDQAAWRGTLELDGGAFMNQASHYVDLLHWLLGPVSKVHAMLSTTLDIEVEDTGVLNLEWFNGALGSMSVTMLTYPKNLEGSITILGENGSVRVGGVAVNDIQHWEFKVPMKYDKEVKNTSYQTSSVYGDGHSLYYTNVVNVLRGVSDPETDGRDGLNSLEIIIAAYHSSTTGKIVSLPLNKKYEL